MFQFLFARCMVLSLTNAWHDFTFKKTLKRRCKQSYFPQMSRHQWEYPCIETQKDRNRERER